MSNLIKCCNPLCDNESMLTKTYKKVNRDYCNECAIAMTSKNCNFGDCTKKGITKSNIGLPYCKKCLIVYNQLF